MSDDTSLPLINLIITLLPFIYLVASHSFRHLPPAQRRNYTGAANTLTLTLHLQYANAIPLHYFTNYTSDTLSIFSLVAPCPAP
jgi:hypothetical protein